MIRRFVGGALAVALFWATLSLFDLTRPLAAQISSSTARHIIPGKALPATCSPSTGDVFFKTTATVGGYQCLTANTWTAIGAGAAGSSGPSGPSGPVGPSGVAQCGSGTIDFGSISSLGFATGTFTLSGAATGNSLAYQIPATLEAGLDIMMLVTASNTVTVYAFNISGSPIDPASNTFGACIASQTGASGPTGPIGPSGTPGGPSGPSGPTGATGASGATGPSGPSGASGPTGATGSTGSTGATGPSGPSGPSGATGASGGSGPSGAAGSGVSGLTTDAIVAASSSTTAATPCTTCTLTSSAQTMTVPLTNSYTATASTPAVKYSGDVFAGTGTTSTPVVYIMQATASAPTGFSTAGTLFGIQTKSSFTGDLFNFMINGTSYLKLNANTGGLTSASNVSAASYTATSSNGFIVSNKSYWSSGTDGIWTAFNAAGTGFTRLNLGGTTSSFPAIARSSAGLIARLADDSADTTLRVSALLGGGGTPSVDATNCTGATIGTGAKNSAGTITGLPTGTCSVVVTFSGVTATTGWVCSVSDQTTANLFRQSANTTTTATFAGTSVASDVLAYSCTAY